jgi:hypothetical protein
MSFGHSFLLPIALIVVIGFALVDALLVVRLPRTTRDLFSPGIFGQRLETDDDLGSTR